MSDMKVLFLGSSGHYEICIISAPLDSAVVDVIALAPGEDWTMPAQWINDNNHTREVKSNPWTNLRGETLYRFERKQVAPLWLGKLNI